MLGARTSYQPPTTHNPQPKTHNPQPTTHVRKAISLTVQLWIEADDEASHDFAQSTTQAVREILEGGTAKHPELSIKIRSIKEKS